MAPEAITTYFHFAGIITLFIALTLELLLFKPGLSVRDAKLISKADATFGIAAIIILTTGFMKIYLYGKGPDYYWHNHLLLGKLLFFLIVGLLSIVPTIYFLKWRPQLKAGEAPEISDKDYKKIKRIIHIELGLAAFIPLMATFMARGFGYVN